MKPEARKRASLLLLVFSQVLLFPSAPSASAETVDAGITLTVKPMPGPTVLKLASGGEVLRLIKLNATKGGTLDVTVSGSASVPIVTQCESEGDISAGAVVGVIGGSPGTTVSASFTPIGRDPTGAAEQQVTEEIVADDRTVSVALCLEAS